MSVFGFSIVGLDDLKIADHLEDVRRIRNAGREWMTEDKSEITAEQQREWWERSSKLPRSDFDLAVYYWPDWPLSGRLDTEVVGYGMLTRRDGLLYVSLAVDPEYRGRGFGSDIYSAIFHNADESVYAAIYENNIASIKAAEKAKFKFLEKRDNMVVYVRTR